MNDHVVKPVNVRELYATLARWVRPRSTAISTPSPSDTDASRVPAAALDLLRGIAGLDLARGLECVGGNSATYLRLLGKFRSNHGDSAARIRAALLDGDHEAAARAAHTLSGVSGNMGAMQVFQAAHAVEATCRSGRPPAASELDALGAALDELNAALDRALNSLAGEPVAPLPTPDKARAAVALRELRQRLDDFDATAADALESLRGCLNGNSKLEQIGRHLGRYDFLAASAVAEALERELGLQAERSSSVKAG
jgi:polar amino acid transport system substrate-binding protein